MPHSTAAQHTQHDGVATASTILKAMANEHRLLALLALAQRPLAVHELNRHLPLAQSALSQHLARLREAGLVVCQRDGSRIRYALADERVRRLVDTLCAEYQIPRQSPSVKRPAMRPVQEEPAAAVEGAARV